VVWSSLTPVHQKCLMIAASLVRIFFWITEAFPLKLYF
jgi:hypothetical protein